MTWTAGATGVVLKIGLGKIERLVAGMVIPTTPEERCEIDDDSDWVYELDVGPKGVVYWAIFMLMRRLGLVVMSCFLFVF